MAAVMFMRYRNQRLLRRNRIFRDRTHPLEIFSNEEVFRKFRFPREAILDLTDSVEGELEYLVDRRGALPPVLQPVQVLLTLRFYATGTFQDVVGELIGVHQSTVSRSITKVTEALLRQLPHWVKLPSQQQADNNKVKFFQMQRFPNVIGCIDGTHVKIQAPREQEHEYVNRKNFHSINVQVICDADLMFINIIAKWPGSVHDARILRESPLFAAFEGNRPPLDGIILGDSGYMLRTWLMTPLLQPACQKEVRYNFAHSSTRTTVERCIGVAKQRWQCLRVGLRLQPPKACKVILVCLMLHNRARRLNIPDAPNDPESDDSSSEDSDADDLDSGNAQHPNMSERARLAAGKTVRERIINGSF